MANDCINVLVISTNGLLKDGITAWLVATFGAMDLDGLSVATVAYDDAERSVIEDVEAAGVAVSSTQFNCLFSSSQVPANEQTLRGRPCVLQQRACCDRALPGNEEWCRDAHRAFAQHDVLP